MKAFQNRMDVIGNNIANSNTTGFKHDRTAFSDSFNQTLSHASPGNSASAGTAAIQIGSGVALTAVKTNYSQAALSRTGVPTDLAVSGEGFFMVRDAVTNLQYATRAGDFPTRASRRQSAVTGLDWP